MPSVVGQITKGAVFDSIVDAGDSGVDISAFGVILSSADTTVQAALDTLDDHNHDGAYELAGAIATHAAVVDAHHSEVHSHLEADITDLAHYDTSDFTTDFAAENLASLATKAHGSLTGVSIDQHHAQSHNIASHSDTTATGPELDTLTDGSETALHSHAGGGAHTLDSHSNVTITSITNNELLQWSGTAWINQTIAEMGIAITGDLHSEAHNHDGDALGTLTSLIVDNITIDGNVISGSIGIGINAETNISLTASDDVWVTANDISLDATDFLVFAGSDIDFKASGNVVDFIRFQTVTNVPRIVTVGACNLTIAPDGGTTNITGILAVSGNITGGNVTSGNDPGHSHTQLHVEAHTLGSHSNITITTIAAGEIIKWSGSAWINNTLAEANISAIGHAHIESDITDLNHFNGADARSAVVSDSIYGAGWNGVTTYAASKNVIYDELQAHYALIDVHHTESHSIVSHSDTTATGTELDTLTGGGETTLHSHAGGGGGGTLTGDGVAGRVPYYTAAQVLGNEAAFLYDFITNKLTIGDISIKGTAVRTIESSNSLVIKAATVISHQADYFEMWYGTGVWCGAAWGEDLTVGEKGIYLDNSTKGEIHFYPKNKIWIHGALETTESVSVNGDLILSQNHKLIDRSSGNSLAFQSLQDGKTFEFDLAGHSDENVFFILVTDGFSGVGSYNQFRMDSLSGNYNRLFSHSDGTVRELRIYAGSGNNGQIICKPNGDVQIGAGPLDFTFAMGSSTKDPTTDAPIDWVEVEISGVKRYLPAYAA